MKFFSLIFSYYLLLLSCLPCDHSHSIMSGTKFKVKISNTSEDKDEDKSENCTSFCNCSSCGTIMIIKDLPELNNFNIVLQTSKYPLHKASFRSEVSFCIWQPPKFNA